MALTRLAHSLIREHFTTVASTEGVAVDATCGNGHDTEFLARLGFKQVVGFDIQENAIRNTQNRLDHTGLSNVHLHNVGHQCMNEYLDQKISCAMFNFGYLPNADKSITTLRDTSLQALKIALGSLRDDGLISLICYPGHAEGLIEKHTIEHWLSTIDSRWKTQQYLSRSPKKTAPILYTIDQANSEMNKN